jgi:hypothetical protein
MSYENLRFLALCGTIRRASKTTYYKRQRLQSIGSAMKPQRPHERGVVMSTNSSLPQMVDSATYLFAIPHNQVDRAFLMGGAK